MTDEIKSVVLTGGPCAGKTTALDYISEKLRSFGIGVVIVPETVRELIKGGIIVGGKKLSDYDFQKLIVKRQISSEEFFRAKIQHFKHTSGILLCDRGLLDGAAYMGFREYTEMLSNEFSLSITDARDKRYDGVIHLVTAANGAESFYVTDDERKETPREARIIDEKIKDAWTGCPHLSIIDNRIGFNKKMKRAFVSVCRVIGIPAPLEIERKFLVEAVDISKIPATVVSISIEQVYLKSQEDIQRRIRLRSQDDSFVCYETFKKDIKEGVRHEKEKQISHETYLYLLRNEMDPRFEKIVKTRHCFIWDNQYFELDEFHNPKIDIMLLEIELTEENDTATTPHFITVIKEVTGDKSFFNSTLALKK